MGRGVIVILDYGVGNVGSIANMFKRIGVEALVSSASADLQRATKLILPGVGTFDEGMRELATRDLVRPLEDRVLGDGVPILGICLGAQLMTKGSEEGERPGLGWVEIDTVRFKPERCERPIKIPHMGWCDVSSSDGASLFSDLPQKPRFYFVHSYHFLCHDEIDVAATAVYGYRFTCAFAKKRIHGVQFHPEKSHVFGMALLRRFSELS
jgi:imidazole glycerol-phosphate synthase subunit HisH